MSLRKAVAAPFRTAGTSTLAENEFVVALTLDRDWFSPDQAERLVDVATGEGLLERDGDDLRTTFDHQAVSIPEEFQPGEDVLQTRSTFERVVAAVVETGREKRAVVAGVNRVQSELGVSVEAAAVVYARRAGVSVAEHADRVREGI